MPFIEAKNILMGGHLDIMSANRCFLSKSQALLLYLSIFTLLFMGNNVLHALGWNIDYYAAPTYQKLRPEFYLMLWLFFTMKKNMYSLEIKICLFSCFVFVYWLLTGQSSGFAVLINTICLPAMLSLSLRNASEKQKHTVWRIVMLFFITNSCVALTERLLGIQVFSYYAGGEASTVFDTNDMFDFRSVALRNHPLCNSLMTAIIMSFIVISLQIKVVYKTVLFILGFMAIMAFNARSSIMIVTGMTFVYFLYNFTVKKVSNISKWQIAMVTLLCVIIVFYLFNQGWGGRLLVKDNLSDTSVEARILIYQTFLASDFTMFLFGMSNEEISHWAKLGHIESFWILYLCRFGIFIFVAYVVMFWKTLKYWVARYNIVNAVYVVLIFLLVSSTNNSLYYGDPGIAVFVLCAASFKTRTSA